jgi:hypothetical protein
MHVHMYLCMHMRVCVCLYVKYVPFFAYFISFTCEILEQVNKYSLCKMWQENHILWLKYELGRVFVSGDKRLPVCPFFVLCHCLWMYLSFAIFFCGNDFTLAGREQAEIRRVTSVVQCECNLDVITETELHHLNNLSVRIRSRTCHCQLITSISTKKIKTRTALKIQFNYVFLQYRGCQIPIQ